MLMNALAAIALLNKQNDVYVNSPVANRYFRSGSPDDARPGLLHTANLWTRWTDLTEAVRSGTAVAHEELAVRGTDWTEAFIAAMDRNARERAALVVRSAGAEDVKRMLDAGGGSGAYAIAFAKAFPNLSADILDLAAVAPIAQRHIDRAGVTERVHVRAGDIRTGPLGRGYDLVFLSAICHMFSDTENRDLLSRCYTALEPGGRIVIQDFILEPSKTAPKSATLFSLNMLVGTRGGSSYSEPEYVCWLESAGFRDIRRVRLPGPTGLMIASRG
jgi:predicted O-methyltransferase YrrM